MKSIISDLKQQRQKKTLTRKPAAEPAPDPGEYWLLNHKTPFAERQRVFDLMPLGRGDQRKPQRVHSAKLNRSCKVRGISWKAGETVERLTEREAWSLHRAKFGCGRQAKPFAELVAGPLFDKLEKQK